MSCVNIRGCCIGEGRPKVIIPIVEPTETAVLEKAAEFSTLRADCVEWRIDCFEGAKDYSAIVHCAAKLRVALKDQTASFHLPHKGRGRQSRSGPRRVSSFYPHRSCHRLRRSDRH